MARLPKALPYSIEQIEDCLTAIALETIGVKPVKNRLLRASVDRLDPEALAWVKGYLPELSLGELSNHFELLIPDQDRQLNGAFFTPEIISRFMAAAVVETGDDQVCDPSCGCGAILLAAAETISQRYDKPLRETIEENIYGVDLCDYNLRRAQLLLNLLVVAEEGDQKTVKANLKQGNSLDISFAALFPKVFAGGGFDCVIGNPPYVRFQHLDERVRVDLQKFDTIDDGNYNLYLPFFELGRNLLNEQGRLAFITPNAFFTVKAARAFRCWARENTFIDTIYDFGANRVFDVSAYTLIALADRRPKKVINYARLDGSDDLNRSIRTSAVAYRTLTDEKWDMLSARQRKMVNKIESDDNIPLTELVDIRGGLATLRDRLYMAESDEQGQVWVNFADRRWPLESEATKPLVRISDFASETELKANQRRIIYPYHNGAIIAEAEMRQQFPQTMAYLDAIAPELKQRDKGKKDYPTFYAYGRSQGLTPPGPCLYTPLYASWPRFLKSQDDQALIINGLALTAKGDYDLNLLRLLLNDSPVLDFYMKTLGQTIAGGYAHYRASLLYRFRLPRLNKSQIKHLKAHHDQRLIEELYGL